MENSVYIVYAETDMIHRSRFYGIYSTAEKADEVVQELRSKLPDYARRLVRWEKYELDKTR